MQNVPKNKKRKVIKFTGENHEFPFRDLSSVTQGEYKMIRLVDGLIRNQVFMNLLEQIIRPMDELQELRKKDEHYLQRPERKEEWKIYIKEKYKIIDEYEKLRKRARKLINNKLYKIKEKIALEYGLDDYLIDLAIARYKKDRFWVSNILLESGGMCRIHGDLEENVFPLNKGDDFSKINPKKQLELLAFPLSIAIHRKATKRDVLDFIEKDWSWISTFMKDYENKSYRGRKRKYSQKMLDYIWQSRSLPVKKIKEKIDIKFPEIRLAYYEISKIIYLEKQRRIKNLEN